MQRQVQECKDVNSIGWVGPSRHGNTNVVGIVNRRASSDKDVPHLTSSLFRRCGEGRLHWVCLGELSCLQYLMSLQLQNRERVPLPSIDSTHRTLLIPTLTTLATATCSTYNVNLCYHRKRNHHGSRVHPPPTISTPHLRSHLRHCTGTHLFQPEVNELARQAWSMARVGFG
jgi:hypothetical protein